MSATGHKRNKFSMKSSNYKKSTPKNHFPSILHAFFFVILIIFFLIAPIFLGNIKKRFVVEYWDRSHFKDCSLDNVVLEFHCSSKIISQ